MWSGMSVVMTAELSFEGHVLVKMLSVNEADRVVILVGCAIAVQNA